LTNRTVYIQTAEKSDLSAILNLIKDYEHYDVEFAKRYYDIYFGKNKMTEKDEVFVAKIDGKTIDVIGFCRDYFSTDYSYWLVGLLWMKNIGARRSCCRGEAPEKS
jgi:hypothetical protein